jgi:hypothetical protein
MFKVSVIESRNQRRLVLEGKLIAPWAEELRTACEVARSDLDGRELVVEVKNLTAINQAGENVLLELMQQGVKFRCCGIFTKHVLKVLARRARIDGEEAS